MSDEVIKCADCGKEFIHSTRDQEFFAQKGWTERPKRCRPCRQGRRAMAEKKSNEAMRKNKQ